MKEATGELNMTVIVVVALAAIGSVFYIFILPIIRNKIEVSTRCVDLPAGATITLDDGTETTCPAKRDNGQ